MIRYRRRRGKITCWMRRGLEEVGLYTVELGGLAMDEEQVEDENSIWDVHSTEIIDTVLGINLPGIPQMVTRNCMSTELFCSAQTVRGSSKASTNPQRVLPNMVRP